MIERPGEIADRRVVREELVPPESRPGLRRSTRIQSEARKKCCLKILQRVSSL